jgi:hypothetical protein
LEKETPRKKKLEGRGNRGEKDKFKILDQRCRTRKMFPLNPREKQNLVWSWNLFKKFQ